MSIVYGPGSSDDIMVLEPIRPLDFSVFRPEAAKAPSLEETSATFSPTEWPDLFTPSGIQYAIVDPSHFESRGLMNAHWYHFKAWTDRFCLGEDAWIAGGFFERILSGQKPNDVDIFFKDFNGLKETFEEIWPLGHRKPFKVGKKYEENGSKEFSTWDEAEPYILAKECRFVEIQTDDYRVQLIKAWYNATPAETIDRFDLTVSQFAYDGQNIIFHPMALNDVQTKKLVLHRLHLPTSTLRRILKYRDRGYEVCGGFMVDFMRQSVAVGSKTPASLDANYLYVD